MSPETGLLSRRKTAGCGSVLIGEMLFLRFVWRSVKLVFNARV